MYIEDYVIKKGEIKGNILNNNKADEHFYMFSIDKLEDIFKKTKQHTTKKEMSTAKKTAINIKSNINKNKFKRNFKKHLRATAPQKKGKGLICMVVCAAYFLAFIISVFLVWKQTIDPVQIPENIPGFAAAAAASPHMNIAEIIWGTITGGTVFIFSGLIGAKITHIFKNVIKTRRSKNTANNLSSVKNKLEYVNGYEYGKANTTIFEQDAIDQYFGTDTYYEIRITKSMRKNV